MTKLDEAIERLQSMHYDHNTNVADRAARDEVIEAARAYREMQWRPIESAPLDGREVIVFDSEDSAFPFIAHYRRTPEFGWFRDFAPRIGVNPTHWKPLPQPPHQGERE